MAELQWFSLSLPRDLELKNIVALLRPLAHRRRFGLTNSTPIVVFETCSVAGTISWRLGVDVRIASGVPTMLRAQMPRLGVVALQTDARPALTLAGDLRLSPLTSTLRLDTAGSVAAGAVSAMRTAASDETVVLQWVVGPGRPSTTLPAEQGWRESLGLRTPEQPDATALKLWREKSAEPLLACRGRIGATAATPARAYMLIRAVSDALRLANGPKAKLLLSKTSSGRAGRLANVSRSFSWSCLLNAPELATVLAWPVMDPVVDGLPLVGGHINLAPAELLVSASNADETPDRLIGESLHPAQRGELVRMSEGSSLHHLHLIGPTGSGKSTLLANLILADIAAGRGVLVVEPRGDLVQDVLARIPAHRQDDVVVIDPADTAHGVVGLNVLSGPVETAERRADELVGLLASMAGGNWGPRTADIAIHSILTASRLPDGTLPDVLALLTNPSFRREVLAKVADPMVLSPWWAWYDALSSGEQANIVAPLGNKLRAFLSREAIRTMVGQPTPAFSFDDLFTKQRIVLVNLNRGQLGGPSANLLGALVLSNVWSALQRRAGRPRQARDTVGLFVDEFQDYVGLAGGLDFGDALAQSRGLGGAFTVAHQHFGQLSSTLEAAVVANARSRITFRPATDDAKRLAGSFGSALTAEDLLRLNAYEAVAQLHVGGSPTAPFAVRTRALGPFAADPNRLRLQSAKRYGADGKAVDAALQARWQGSETSSGPVGFKRRRAS